MATNINQALADFLLQRVHYISRFENGTIQELVSHYARAKPQIIQQIKDLEDLGTGYTLQWRLNRLNSRLNEINAVLKHADEGAIHNLTEKLTAFSRQEKIVQERLLGSTFGQIGVNITRIPLEQIDEMLTTPLGGATYAERMAQRYGESVFALKQELTQAMLQGKDMARASRDLFGIGEGIGGTIGGRIQDQCDVIARTEIMRVSNGVRDAVYEGNQDILKGVQHLSTLDPRTCLACASLDGKLYEYGVNDVQPQNEPPIHPNCRCVLIPVTKSWEDLGATGKLPPEYLPGERPFGYTGIEPPKGFKGVGQYADPTKWGGQVADTMDYGTWLGKMDKADPEFVKDILGPARYKYWKAGDLELKQMVTGNKVLPLDQLESFHEVEEGGPGSGYADHPGRPGEVGGSAPGGGMSGTKVVDGVRVGADGTLLPDHIGELKIPPAWTGVAFNPDPDADLLVKGKDAKGRSQYIYSTKFQETQAAAKFARVKELGEKFDSIYKQNEANRGALEMRENADCLKVIMDTGIRPGSDKETGGKVKAYGATTLEGRHVVKVGGRVELQFVGKKGVKLKIPVMDKGSAAILLARAKKAGANGRLFDTDSDTLSEYTHTMDGGGFKTKDFRTNIGTTTALKEISGMKRPVSLKEYKASVRKVAKVVAAKLGNTPTVALQSYIAPEVFSRWRLAA